MKFKRFIYPICKGRKFKKKKLKKLIKPLCCWKKSIIENYKLTEKNKLRFIQQFFRFFFKDFRFYKMSSFIKKKYIISNLDIINIAVKIQKAGWKKLLLKLDYCMKDYKTLKRRSYSLNFKFFFLNIEDCKNKEITLDIKGKSFDVFDIFITINGFFLDEFYNIINIFNKKVREERRKEEREKDENDLILENLDHVYGWHRANKILYYDAYMPWYISKEDYCMYRQFKRKFERKYFCIIREKKLKSIFPLKCIGHLIVSDKKKGPNMVFWTTLFIKSYFETKDDFFKELKNGIRRIDKEAQINTFLVYFFIQLIE